MNEYFFDVHSPEGVRTDEIGTIFVNAAAARSEARIVVRQMARMRAQTHAAPLAVTIVIRDDEGYVVDAVGLSSQKTSVVTEVVRRSRHDRKRKLLRLASIS